MVWQIFKLPDDCMPMAMMAVAYQSEADTLADDFQDAERAERSRASSRQPFFNGKWGGEFR